MRALHIHRSRSAASPDQAKVLNNLAPVRVESGAPEEAEKLYREALGIRDASPDGYNPDSLPAIEGLSMLLRKSERYAEAEKLDSIAIGIRVKHTLAEEQGR
jgi:hypothetical protein